jgi:hypothetical protein
MGVVQFVAFCLKGHRSQKLAADSRGSPPGEKHIGPALWGRVYPLWALQSYSFMIELVL